MEVKTMTEANKQLIESILESIGLEKLRSPLGRTYPVVPIDSEQIMQDDWVSEEMAERKRHLPDIYA